MTCPPNCPALLTAADTRLGRIGGVTCHLGEWPSSRGRVIFDCPCWSRQKPAPRSGNTLSRPPWTGTTHAATTYWHLRKDLLISTSTLDSALFSHPVAEQLRSGERTTPQGDRYGSLFLQPEYTPAPATDGGTEPANDIDHARKARGHTTSFGRRARP